MKTKALSILLLIVFLSACASPTPEPPAATDIPLPAPTEMPLPSATLPPPTDTPIPATPTLIPAEPTHTTAPSRTPIPFPSSTPTTFGGSPTPSVPTAFTEGENEVACSKGPGKEYSSKTGYKFPGGAEIVGTDMDDKWWYVKIRYGLGQYKYCWMPRKSVATGGDLSPVPVVEPEEMLVTVLNIYLVGDYTQTVSCAKKADSPVFRFTAEIVADGPVKTVKYTWETSAGVKFKQEVARIRSWDEPARLKLNLTVPAQAGTYSLTLRTVYPNEMSWVVQFNVKCQ